MNLASEKDEILEPVATKDNSEVKVEEEDTNRQEAWTISEMKPSKAGSLTMLTMIGKVLVKDSISNKMPFQKRKCYR